jgi:hypothetical protein
MAEVIHQYKAPRSAKLFNDKFAMHFGAGIYRGFGLQLSHLGGVLYLVRIRNEILPDLSYMGVLTDPNGLIVHETVLEPDNFQVTEAAGQRAFVICRITWAEDMSLQPTYQVIDVANYDSTTDVILGYIDRDPPLSIVSFAPPGPHNWAPEHIYNKLGGVEQSISFDLRNTEAAHSVLTSIVANHAPIRGGSKSQFTTAGTVVNRLRLRVWGYSSVAPAGVVRTFGSITASSDDAAFDIDGGTENKDISAHANNSYLLYDDAVTLFSGSDMDEDWYYRATVQRQGNDAADTYLQSVFYTCAELKYNRIAIGESL